MPARQSLMRSIFVNGKRKSLPGYAIARDNPCYGEHGNGLGGAVTQLLGAAQGVQRVHLGGGFTDLGYDGGGVCLGSARIPNFVGRAERHIEILAGDRKSVV